MIWQSRVINRLSKSITRSAQQTLTTLSLTWTGMGTLPMFWSKKVDLGDRASAKAIAAEAKRPSAEDTNTEKKTIYMTTVPDIVLDFSLYSDEISAIRFSGFKTWTTTKTSGSVKEDAEETATESKGPYRSSGNGNSGEMKQKVEAKRMLTKKWSAFGNDRTSGGFVHYENPFSVLEDLDKDISPAEDLQLLRPEMDQTMDFAGTTTEPMMTVMIPILRPVLSPILSPILRPILSPILSPVPETMEISAMNLTDISQEDSVTSMFTLDSASNISSASTSTSTMVLNSASTMVPTSASMVSTDGTQPTLTTTLDTTTVAMRETNRYSRTWKRTESFKKALFCLETGNNFQWNITRMGSSRVHVTHPTTTSAAKSSDTSILYKKKRLSGPFQKPRTFSKKQLQAMIC